VSHLLVKPESAAGEFDFAAPRDYLPDPNIDWVVTIDFEESVAREQISGLLDAVWLENHERPTVYGFSPGERHWTYVNATDSPESFSRLKIAWSLWDAIDEKPKELSLDDLRRLKDAVEERISVLGSFNVEIDRGAEDSLAVVQSLPEIVEECNRDVTLILRAPDGTQFSGREVWDVMLCLGLDYGDGDLFHWINNSGFGDDQFFTVQTSTPPGYFIPERIASGDGGIDDLMFNFSIPRSANPVAVFDSMSIAVQYARKRLGGEFMLRSSEPFDRTAQRAKVEEIVEKLNEAGFSPGEHSTCRVF
jgi:cell division protein ZipA